MSEPVQPAADPRTLIEHTALVCEETLQRPALVELSRRFQQVTEAPLQMVASLIAARSEAATSLPRLREKCGAGSDSTFERYCILTAAKDTLKQLGEAPLPTAVKTLTCEQIQFVCRSDESQLARYRAGNASFERLWKIASLQRFPAGLFEWEVSGISRSDCLKTSIVAWPRVGAFIALRMRGLKPVFFSHLSRAGNSLNELEANRSYYRMAMALAQQPHVLGFAACSWFRAPATHRVSPHLAWMSDVFRNNGGLVVDAGPDGPESGALYRSPTRRALYEAGQWVPTRGLVMWPRAAMLAWAERHPELSD